MGAEPKSKYCSPLCPALLFLSIRPHKTINTSKAASRPQSQVYQQAGTKRQKEHLIPTNLTGSQDPDKELSGFRPPSAPALFYQPDVAPNKATAGVYCIDCSSLSVIHPFNIPIISRDKLRKYNEEDIWFIRKYNRRFNLPSEKQPIYKRVQGVAKGNKSDVGVKRILAFKHGRRFVVKIKWIKARD